MSPAKIRPHAPIDFCWSRALMTRDLSKSLAAITVKA